MILIQSIVIACTLLYVSAELTEMEEQYLTLFVQMENLKKDMLQLRIDLMEEKSCPAVQYEDKQKSRERSKPVFDARVDSLPSHCQTEQLPSNCAKAMECTETSGYYNLSIGDRAFQGLCDYTTQGGDWLRILQRVDGSVNFSRPWSEYVNGFGELDNEYWIGLENLYALTNYDGPQELYVYMENFEGQSRYARYENFKVGNADEHYKLKTLGRYTGSAGDSMSYSLDAPFTTYDQDRDNHPTLNCANVHKGGWWFKTCARTIGTGFYHRGQYAGPHADGIFWRDWMEYWQSMKLYVMMIRRQRISLN